MEERREPCLNGMSRMIGNNMVSSYCNSLINIIRGGHYYGNNTLCS